MNPNIKNKVIIIPNKQKNKCKIKLGEPVYFNAGKIRM